MAAIGEDFIPDPEPVPIGQDFEPDSTVRATTHRLLNDVREFGAGAGRYIAQGLEGLSEEQARLFANPTNEMVAGTGEEATLPKQEQERLTRQRIADLEAKVPNAKQTAAYWKLRADQADAQSDVDPHLAQAWDSRISRAAGSAAVMGMESTVPVAGLPIMAMHGAAAAEAEALNAGKTPEQASDAAVRSLIGLAIFGGTAKVAALGVAKLLPQFVGNPGALTKFVAQFAGQETANEISTRAINAYEMASQVPPQNRVAAALQGLTETRLETETLNAVFAGMGAAHELGGRAERSAAGPIGTDFEPDPPPTGLSDVRVPGAPTDTPPAAVPGPPAPAPAAAAAPAAPPAWQATPDARSAEYDRLSQNLAQLNQPAAEPAAAAPAAPNNAPYVIAARDRISSGIRFVEYRKNAEGQYVTKDDLTNLPLYEVMGRDAFNTALERSTQALATPAPTPPAAEPPSTTSPARRSAAQSKAAQAEAEHQAELLRQARDIQAGGGKELLEAIADAGGLPSKTAETRAPWKGELETLEETVKGLNENAGRGKMLRSLFRPGAQDLDNLATSLRDQGFDVESPMDLLTLVKNRLTSGKEMFGTPERQDFTHGLRAAEQASRYSKTPIATSIADVRAIRSAKDKWVTEGRTPAGAAGLIDRFYQPNKYRDVAGQDALYVRMPSTSGRNILPSVLADRLQRDRGGTVYDGPSAGRPTAKTEAKHKIGMEAKLADPVRFAPDAEGIEALRSAANGRRLVIVDDVQNTGESFQAFRRLLEDNAIQVDGIATLGLSDKRVTSPRDIERLSGKISAGLGLPLDQVKTTLEDTFSGTFKQWFNYFERQASRGGDGLRLVWQKASELGRAQPAERAGTAPEAARPTVPGDGASGERAPATEQLRLFEQSAANYVDRAGVPATVRQEAINGITRTLSLAADPALAVPYEARQAELFDRRSEGLATTPNRGPSGSKISRRVAAERRALEGLVAGDVPGANQALAEAGNSASIVIPEYITGQRPHWDIVGTKIERPADFAVTMHALRSPYFEAFKVAIRSDRTKRIVVSEVVSQGSLNESIADPKYITGLIAQAKEKYKDVSVLIAHNHPSGDPTPSQTDHSLTRRIEELCDTLGAKLLDHVITDGERYYSFKSYGVEDFPKAIRQAWEAEVQQSMPKIDAPDIFGLYIKRLKAGDPDAAHILYVGTRYNLVGVERVTNGHDVRQIMNRMALGAGRQGAYAVLVDLPGSDISGRSAFTRLRDMADLAQIKILDASWQGMESAKTAGVLEQPGKYRPRLQPGQKQGDLLAGTDQDAFNLAGQEGIDHGARAEAVKRAQLERARAEQEADRDQLRLMEPPSQYDFEEAANDREKQREHIATIQRMTEVSPDVKQRVESWYTPLNLPEVHARAQGTIDRLGLGKAQDAFMTARKVDADMLALGHHVAIRLDQLGRFDEAATIRDAMAERLTSPAQALWFISTIAKTSPEGLIRQAQKVVSDQIRNDPEKMALLDEINRLKAELAALPPEAQPAATEIVIRNLANVNKPGQRLTAGQLEKLLRRHKEGGLSEEDLAAALAKYLKVPRLSADNVARIKAAQQAWQQASDPIMRLRRGAEMMDSVYGLIPRTFWDKVRGAATISMILHGRLPVRIGVSNFLQMAGQTTVDTFNAFTLDPLVGVLTGRRTVTGPQLSARLSGLTAPADAFRAGYVDAKARQLGTWPSFKEGVRTLLDMATLTTRGIFDTNEINGRTTHLFSSRFGRLAEDTVTLLHNVVPYAFWNAGYRGSLARQMRAARADVPTAEMIQNARLDANRAIFQNETAAFHMLRGIRRVLDYPTAKITGGKYGFGTATIPFAKVPGAILTEGAAWTPLGFVRAGWESFRPVFTREPFRQKEFIDAFTKAVAGTGSLVATGYWLAKLGVISGPPEDNKDLEAMRRSAGMGAYRINVSELKRRFLAGNFTTRMGEPYGQDGDLTVGYNWLEPVAFPLGMGADIAHSHDKREVDLKRGKITSNAAVTAMQAGLLSLTSHPMMQGTEKFMTTFAEQGPGPAGLGVVANVPGNFVPSLVRQTAQYIDNRVRENRGGSLIDREASRLVQQIPWLSQRYPARYDVFGEAIQRYNYANNTLLNVFFNPAQPNDLRKNPSVNELMRLFEQTADSHALPTAVPRTVTVNGKQIELDNAQLATYQRYVGQLGSAGIARLLASPQFAAESPAIKTSTISQVLEAVNTAAKIDLFGQKLYSVGTRGSVRIPSPSAFAELYRGRALGLNQPAPIGQ